MNRDQYLAKREWLYGKSAGANAAPARGGPLGRSAHGTGAPAYRMPAPLPVRAGNWVASAKPARGWEA